MHNTSRLKSPAIRKPLSSGWLRFAERIADTAGVQEPTMRERVIQAFASVPRDKFMSPALSVRATDDHAFPIGYGQTISKPSTVARMVAVAGIRPGMRVLEVGCGSGYCSAILSAMGAEVFAIEYVGLLAQVTRRKLDALNFHTIFVRTGDGRRGWPEHAPYDAIIVSAAFERIEDELLAQLVVPRGRLVAPIGGAQGQQLIVWEAATDGLHRLELESCRFVEGQGC